MMDDDLTRALRGSSIDRYILARQPGGYRAHVREKLLGQLPLQGVVTQVFFILFYFFKIKLGWLRLSET